MQKLANLLAKQIGANKNAIKIEQGKELPYNSIYSLRPVEFKTLKTYIEINLANGFISILKLLVSAPILFVYKPNSSLYLCVNYQRLNNLIIKNCYLLSLIKESLDWLGRAK